MSKPIRLWCPQCGKSCGRIVWDGEFWRYVGQTVPHVGVKRHMPEHLNGKLPHVFQIRPDPDPEDPAPFMVMCGAGHSWRLYEASLREALRRRGGQKVVVPLYSEFGHDDPYNPTADLLGRVRRRVEIYTYWSETKGEFETKRIEHPEAE